MKRTCFLLAAGAMCHAILPAQTQPGAMGFQQADSLAAGRGGRGINIIPLLRPDTGKPFSATVTTQTTQTFLDGTHVSQTTTTLEYRDADGRTRVEPERSAAIILRNIRKHRDSRSRSQSNVWSRSSPQVRREDRNARQSGRDHESSIRGGERRPRRRRTRFEFRSGSPDGRSGPESQGSGSDAPGSQG